MYWEAMSRNRNYCSVKGLHTVWYENHCSATSLLLRLVGPMHFLFAICENYALLHVISNWTKLSIPCGVISSTDVTMVTSSLQNFQKMLKIEFPTKRISIMFIMFKKWKKRQRLVTYIWYDPRTYIHKYIHTYIHTYIHITHMNIGNRYNK